MSIIGQESGSSGSAVSALPIATIRELDSGTDANAAIRLEREGRKWARSTRMQMRATAGLSKEECVEVLGAIPMWPGKGGGK